MGLANDRSLAWGIARAVADQGGELAFSYQGEALEKRVRPLAERAWFRPARRLRRQRHGGARRDVRRAQGAWDTLDFVVHAIGFSDKNELRGKFVDTSMDNFLMTMNISVYSFVAVAQRARAMMTDGGSLLTLSYYGAEKVIPHYNVMGVAKAGARNSRSNISPPTSGPRASASTASRAGPIKTLAASGIGDFRYIMKWNEYNSPLRRNVTIEDVGGAGLYLLHDLASGVTGEIHHVDAGYNVVGMKAEDAPDIPTV